MTQTTQHTIDCASNHGGDCDCPMGRMPLAAPIDFRGILASYIGTAYTHEEEFLEVFCEGMEAKDLVEIYMAENRTKIYVVVPSGTVIGKTISTTKFMKWADEKNGNTFAI